MAAFGMAGFPPADMTCQEQPFPNPGTQYVHCEFPPVSKFVTTGESVTFPSALLVPRTGKAKLRAHFLGYNPKPFGACDDWNFSAAGEIVTKNCPEPTDGRQLDWGGAYHGELAYGWRIAATIKYAQEHYQGQIDYGAGITLEGCSYGGTTAILQSVIMPEPFTKSLITVIHAVVPNTLMVKQDAPVGMYWKNPAVRLAWANYDWTQADIRTHAPGQVYYRLNGSPPQFDNLVVFDTAVFPAIEAQHIPVFGTWHNCGHAPNCAGINLPWFDTYQWPGMSHRLDQPQVAITHFDQNSPITDPVGHWNLGIGWLNSGMIDTATRTAIPLRYIAHKNIGGGVPDQLDRSSFEVTLRNTKQVMRGGDIVNWTFGSQSGTAIAEAGLVTITGLTLGSSDQYTTLTITRH